MPQGSGEVKPLRIRALLASRWLAFNVMVLAASLALSVWHYSLLDQADASFAAVSKSIDRIAVASIVSVVVFLVGAVVFLFWFARAYGNLEPLGSSTRYRRGWAVGSWFVPILNLFRPKQIANDLWRGSDPDAYAPKAGTGEVPSFIHWWWFLWLFGTIGERIYATESTATIQEERNATVLLIGTQLVELLAGMLAILLVHRVTRRQEERAARLRERAPTAPVAA